MDEVTQNPGVKAVVIATPAATHYRMAKEALLHRKDDLRMLAGYESKLRLPRSALFKEAIELWLAVREKEEIRKRYTAVYANSNVRGKQLKRVEEMLPLVLELWPKY